MDKTIQFTVIENNKKRVIDTYFGEYRDLMSLLKDKLFIDGFGECGGTGRCSTCAIKIKGLTGDSLVLERNESTTLTRMGLKEENIRLACQILITKSLNNTEIEILEMNY